jgi:hypothetical protein
MDAAGAWHEEDDWSDYEFVGLCRDIKGQRAQHLVIILSNAETAPGGSVTATRTPYLKRNNIGCWKIQGTVIALENQPIWTGMGRQGLVTVGFELDAAATALDFKHPQFPDTLRLGANVLMSPSGTFSFEVAYGNRGCSNRFGPATFNIAPLSGFLKTNSFPELHSPDAAVTAWLNQPARAYVGALVDNASIAEVVTGVDCDSPVYSVVGGLLTTNDEKNGVYVNPPQVLPDGRFAKSFSESGFTFDWLFTPQRQP